MDARTVLRAATIHDGKGERITMMLIDVEELAGEHGYPENHPLSQWVRRCKQAAELVEDHPDEAALLLDGLLGQIAHELALKLGMADESSADMLARIENAVPIVGWRLRLALRAPAVHARLVACRALIAAMSDEPRE